ncbi:MAG: hypothetical protein QMC59_02045 [Candidatus Poseidoniaceae archaeon]|jgi:hypothetical protein|tara:strand:- start:22996 stop:23565 length:570 start_codon:yes stop_codon:yes gene_type:complete
MQFSKTVSAFCVLLLLVPLASASELTGGEDKNPTSDEAPFSIIARDTPSVDGQVWSLSLEMDEEEHANNTVFEIVTQICTNNGVCDPPVAMDASIDERMHVISLTPNADHTYVNWRVKAVYDDGNTTNFPQGDWYKTWSSCWQNDGEYGGIDANTAKDGCSSGDESVPGFSLLVAVSGVAMAAAFTRRE